MNSFKPTAVLGALELDERVQWLPDRAARKPETATVPAAPALAVVTPAPVTPAARDIDAELEAEFIKAREAGMAAGRKAGYQDGYAEGLKAGTAAAGTRAAAALDAQLQLVATIARQLDLQQQEDDLVLIVHAAIGHLAGETTVQRGVIEHAVRTALAAGQMPVSVRVAPEDHAWLATRWAEAERAELASKVSLLADPAVQAGGCVIETAAGKIDARLETQLAAITRTLLQTRSLGGAE